MTYDNGPWGAQHMGQVFAHETVHVFYALDEFAGSDAYWEHSSYCNTQNHSGAKGHPDLAKQSASLFAERPLQDLAYQQHTSSASSLKMIGWKDSDGDGIFDVLHVPMTLTGLGSFDQPAGIYRFAGTSQVKKLLNQNPRVAGHDATLNTIDVIQYRLDQGSWTDARSYGADETEVSMDVPISTVGDHTIEIRTIDHDSSVDCDVLSDRFVSPKRDTPPTGPSIVLGQFQRGLPVPLTDASGTAVKFTLRSAGSGILVRDHDGSGTAVAVVTQLIQDNFSIRVWPHSFSESPRLCAPRAACDQSPCANSPTDRAALLQAAL